MTNLKKGAVQKGVQPSKRREVDWQLRSSTAIPPRVNLQLSGSSNERKRTQRLASHPDRSTYSPSLFHRENLAHVLRSPTARELATCPIHNSRCAQAQSYLMQARGDNNIHAEQESASVGGLSSTVRIHPHTHAGARVDPQVVPFELPQDLLCFRSEERTRSRSRLGTLACELA